MSLRDDIFAIEDRKIEPVTIPEWNCTIYVRSLSGAERDTLEWGLLDAQKAGKLKLLGRAMLAAAYACDESGAPIWTEADVPKLADKNALALNRIREAGDKLNQMTKAAEEELEKN